jgi:hypothetical protein
MNWIDELLEDAHRSRQHQNLNPDYLAQPVRAPTPAPVSRHSLLAWSVILLGMAGVILLAWWLSGVHLDF